MRQLNLNYEGFEQYLVEREDRNMMNGVQYIFKFENHYGASVIKHDGSYGRDEDLWELAVIKYETDRDKWHLNYGTEITDDVIGWLTDEGVRDLLKRIKEL